MFENCGSCYAAEQFVDIKLGAKYLLPLTSYASNLDNCFFRTFACTNTTSDAKILINMCIEVFDLDRFLRAVLCTKHTADTSCFAGLHGNSTFFGIAAGYRIFGIVGDQLDQSLRAGSNAFTTGLACLLHDLGPPFGTNESMAQSLTPVYS